MKLNRFFCLSLLFFGVTQAQAQDNGYESLAKMFSQTGPTGSARFIGMGGQYSSLGGDVSSISGNPAGLGFYTRSEFSLSPGVSLGSTSSTFGGSNASASSVTNVNLANLSIVFAGNEPQYKGAWRGSFGIGYNRNSSLANSVSFSGNSGSSITDAFAERATAEGISPSDLRSGLMGDAPNYFYSSDAYYWSFLLQPRIGSSPLQFDGVEATKLSPSQNYLFSSTGRTSQWTLSYGGTADEKLYLGFSLGIPSFTYETKSTLKENVTNYDAISSVEYSKILSTSGSGLNITGGFVYRPNETIRFGGSITTPTWYSVDGSYSSSVLTTIDPSKIGGVPLSNYFATTQTDILSKLSNLGYGIVQKNGAYYATKAPRVSIGEISESYNMTNPFKANLGASVFFGKKGFISADAEYVNYKGIGFYTDMDDQDLISNLKGAEAQVKSIYQNVWNLKIGGELRASQHISLRTGYAYYGSPYNESKIFSGASKPNVNLGMQSLTAGIGYKTNSFHLDFGFVHSTTDQIYTPYFLNDNSQASAIIKKSQNNIVASVGIYF
jgi:hypothetical protein